MFIHIAKEKDAKDIAYIHNKCWGSVYKFIPNEVHVNRSIDFRTNQWLDVLTRQDERDLLLVLNTEQGEAIGFCFCTYNKDHEIDAGGELHAAYILPGHRGGVSGLIMMRLMIQHLGHHGLLPPCIWAFDENPMQVWYRAFGWEPVVKRDRVICGARIPETGFVYRDIDKLLSVLDKTIIEKSERLGSQYECRFLSPLQQPAYMSKKIA